MGHQEADIMNLGPSSLGASQKQRGRGAEGMSKGRESKRGHESMVDREAPAMP